MVAEVPQESGSGGEAAGNGGVQDLEHGLNAMGVAGDVVGLGRGVDGEDVVEYDSRVVQAVTVELVSEPGEVVGEPAPTLKDGELAVAAPVVEPVRADGELAGLSCDLARPR